MGIDIQQESLSIITVINPTVDGCEILHQLVDGLSHQKIPAFTMFHSYLMVTLPGAGFRNQPQYVTSQLDRGRAIK